MDREAMKKELGWAAFHVHIPEDYLRTVDSYV